MPLVLLAEDVQVPGCPPLPNPYGLEERHVLMDHLREHGVTVPAGESDTALRERYRSLCAPPPANPPAVDSSAASAAAAAMERDRAERINLEAELKRGFGQRPDPQATLEDLRTLVIRLRKEAPPTPETPSSEKPATASVPTNPESPPAQAVEVGAQGESPQAAANPQKDPPFTTPPPQGRPLMTRREFQGAFLSKRTYQLTDRYGEPDRVSLTETSRGYRWEWWTYRRVTTTDRGVMDDYVWLRVEDKIVTYIRFESN